MKVTRYVSIRMSVTLALLPVPVIPQDSVLYLLIFIGGKGGHREGAGEKHKGFHVATGREGRHAFRPSENKNEKPKPKQKPQTPCQTKRAIT